MVKTDFRYTKEMLFAEFKDAKDKDIKLGKGDDNKVHTNRIKILQEYVDLENQSPEVFEDVKINFKGLLLGYQQKDPRNYFYKRVFGKSYEQVAAESEVTTMADYEKSANIKELETSINEI